MVGSLPRPSETSLLRRGFLSPLLHRGGFGIPGQGGCGWFCDFAGCVFQHLLMPGTEEGDGGRPCWPGLGGSQAQELLKASTAYIHSTCSPSVRAAPGSSGAFAGAWVLGLPKHLLKPVC